MLPKSNVSDRPLLSIIVPVYNEIASLPTLMERLDQMTIDREVILVDDGSTDGSREYLETLKRPSDDRLVIVTHERNRGRGAALRTGLLYARGEVISAQDADLEYHPRELEKLAHLVIRGEADVVYGSRFLGKGSETMSVAQYWGNKVIAGVTMLLYGVVLTDVATCYKVWRAEVIKGLDLQSNGFELEAETTAKLLKAGYKIREMPISFQARGHREGKKLKWKDGIPFVTALFKYRFFA